MKLQFEDTAKFAPGHDLRRQYPNGRWTAYTNNGEYYAVGVDPLTAATRLVDVLTAVTV